VLCGGKNGVKPTISLIILSFNNWGFTYPCLTSLIQSFDASLLERGIEIILVDNGSNPETKQEIDAFGRDYTDNSVMLRFVMLEENLGYPSGVNIGLEQCRGDFIGVLNNDLVFPRGWLAPLIQILEEDKLVGFAAPYLSYAPSSQNIGKEFSSFAEMQEFAMKFTSANEGKFHHTDRVLGACLVFRRDLLASIGGNDFWYGIGNYDDDDWCLRARIAGYKIVIVGSSFVEHMGHATFRLEPTRFNTSLSANRDKFERKWCLNEGTPPIGTNTRNETLQLTRFERGKHFIPYSVNDFSSMGTPLYKRTANLRRWLLCADWTNPQSQWAANLISLLLHHEKVELFLWIPRNIFDVTTIETELQRMLVASAIHFQSKDITFTLLKNEVPYVDMLRLIGSADAVVNVSVDFVNRYIVRLAEQMGMNVVDSTV
jgi:GT2 family glycosyltransferase